MEQSFQLSDETHDKTEISNNTKNYRHGKSCCCGCIADINTKNYKANPPLCIGIYKQEEGNVASCTDKNVLNDNGKITDKVSAAAAVANFFAVFITALYIGGQMNEMGKANELSRSALYAQQRPWIRIVGAGTPDSNVDETSRIPYIFPAMVENIGSIPAVDVAPLGYALIPIGSDWEKNRLPPVLYNNAHKICARNVRQSLFNGRDEKMTAFPVSGGRVLALNMRFKDIETDIDNFINGDSSVRAIFERGVNEAAIIFFVGYRSSIDREIHCTAEAFYVKSAKGVLFTAQDILERNCFCYQQRTDIEVNPNPIGIGFAD